jgi:hypothetical protein
MRYAAHASPRFNDWLEGRLGHLARELAGAVGSDLLAVVLAGGYGRGEGGVQVQGGVERPYNDLDLFVVLQGARRWPHGTLERLARLRAPEFGVPVDVGRPLTLVEIARWPAWLMWHELLHGHVVLHGAADILTRTASAAAWGPPPAIEATRLLLNRGAGLLWAFRVARGLERPPDPDFVRRNRYKTEQAQGDALLIAAGRHRTALAGRAPDLAALCAERADVARLVVTSAYGEALTFKLRPDAVPRGEPAREALADTAQRWLRVFLLVESERTGLVFPDAATYAAWAPPREAAPTGVDLVANLARGALLGRPSWRHPREALYRELPLLLAEAARPSPSVAWAPRGERFLRSWRRFQ